MFLFHEAQEWTDVAAFAILMIGVVGVFAVLGYFENKKSVEDKE